MSSLSEYEQQLSELDSLIAASNNAPPDPTFVQLRSDLIELIALTKATPGHSENIPQNTSTDPVQTVEKNLISHEAKNPGSPSFVFGETNSSPKQGLDDEYDNLNLAATSPAVAASPKASQPSAALPDKFVIPEKLLPLESDSDAVKDKKRRKIKTLKSKFNEKKKEEERAKKQASWKDFMNTGGKKKKKKGVRGAPLKGIAKEESMFRTGTEVNAKVGVVGSGQSMTEYGERKRFKLG